MTRASLRKYVQKRDFGVTAEPRGRVRRGAAERAFVIQRHDARRLHYDFRLELDGVLKSWAVPKGPSLSPKDKRLAVEVEDHPFDYRTFEGAIPKGEYGGGRVLVWDKGIWEPEGDAHKGLKAGHLKFILHGDRVEGRFALVRMKPRGRAKKNNWLLIKEKDEYADLETDVTSVGPLPELVDIHVELAALRDTLPVGDDWVYETKYDGYRAVSSVDGKHVRIVSRNGTEWTERFADIRRALAKLGALGVVLDGEICAINEKGRTDFQALQNQLNAGNDAPLAYFVFDLLFLDGHDVRDRPLHVRKALLASLLQGVPPPLIFAAHAPYSKDVDPITQACLHGFEGVIAKRKDSVYRPTRNGDWVKVKCSQRQEAVVVGFSKGTGAREPLGALLLGVHDGGALRYAGRVGTGFSTKALQDLRKRLAKLAVKEPAVPRPPNSRGVTWVRPQLVVEVGFTEWTEDGAMRHPVYLGVREDKAAAEVVHERAAKTPAKAKKRPSKARKPPANSSSAVTITHPERIVDADSGLTKQGLAQYYAAVSEHLLPYIEGRPLAVVRCPEGAGKECFFQKRKGPGMSDAIHAGKAHGQSVLYVEDAPGLLSLVQFGVVELHGWGARFPNVTKPDMLVMDLDPDPTVPFAKAVDAALAMKDLLEGLGLAAYARTTGGKGVHVVSPLAPRASFDELKAFTQAIANAFVGLAPKEFIAKASKSARKGKIFVDYLRNGAGATAVVSYSVRARDGAPVAVPVTWTELRKVDPQEFNVPTVLRRLSRQRKDPWGDFFDRAHPLPPLSRLG